MLHVTFRREVLAARSRHGIALMGVCNVTPDSFSDGGAAFGVHAARAHIDALLLAGADVVDVGAESTRPGAPAVSSTEQIERLGDAVRYASSRVLTSIDTTRADVAQEAILQGAVLVNDVSMGLHDGGAMAELVARTGAAWCLSHARGTQQAMPGFGAYSEDAYGPGVVATVTAELRTAMRDVQLRGVGPAALLPDPGLGFDKSSAQSLSLLQCTGALSEVFDGWLLVGASRKSFLAASLGSVIAPAERLGASIAAALWAQRGGAAMVRVHDVAQTRQATKLEACLSGCKPLHEHVERDAHA